MANRTRIARALIELTGNNPRTYVPGTLYLSRDGIIDWTENCSARCTHADGCHAARTAVLPSGFVDREAEQ